MASLNFKIEEVTAQPEKREFEMVAEGRYEAIITDSQVKQTKAGNGSYLELTFDILGPTHVGRKMWSRLNIENQSEQAMKIARRQLSIICRAVGLNSEELGDSDELHGVPLEIVVEHRLNKMSNEKRAEIVGYGAAGDVGAAPEPRVAAQPAAVASKPVWKK